MTKRIASGQCNCGVVAFEITADLLGVFVCHCSICRRWTGSNGIPVVVIKNENFRWTRGEEEISTWKKPGHDWMSSFCRKCGSSLPVANDESSVAVPAGLLSEGGERLKVLHHIWVDSKADWDEIGDQGRQHPQAFKG